MATISVTAGDNSQGAANQLQPGDTLLFKAGIHYGRISIPVDDVVISGEVGAILESTEPLESQAWMLATDSDSITSLANTGTWRVPLSKWPWQLLEPNGVSLMRIDSDFVGVTDQLNYFGMSAYSALAVPNNARPGPDYGADWWNGIEAMWVYNTKNGYLYVRYRDGRKPGPMRWSGGHTDHRDPPYAEGSVIWLSGRHNVIIENLEIRGSVDGVAIVDSSNIAVEGCYSSNFDFAVRVYGACQNIRVADNEFDLRDLGGIRVTPISKISTENPYPDARLTAYHVYAMHKFWHDESDSTHGTALIIYNSETGVPKQIEFANNYVRACVNAGYMVGGDGMDFHHNTIENMIDKSFGRSTNNGRNIKIHDNVVREAGYCLIRWNYANEDAGDCYIYNNRVSDCDRVSDFIFHAGSYSIKTTNWLLRFLYWLWELICRLFGKKPVKANPSALRIWYYHNSFSGGNSVWIMDLISSMPGFHAVNNLISNLGNTSNSAGWPADIGLFDYNTMSGALGAWGPWYGGHNVTNMPAIWPCNQVEKEFIVPDGHSSKGTGVDVSRPFMINGKTYGPLPGFEPGYFEGSAPDRGWVDRGEDGGDIVAATFSAVPDSVIPGSDVEISWTGSSSARDWWACYKVGSNHAFDKYGWAYVSCSGTPTVVRPSGTCVFTMPTELGNYEFRLYANDTVTQIAVSNQVTVAEEPVPPQPEPPEEETIMAFIPVWIEKPESVTPIEPSEFQAVLKRKKKP